MLPCILCGYIAFITYFGIHVYEKCFILKVTFGSAYYTVNNKPCAKVVFCLCETIQDTYNMQGQFTAAKCKK